MKQLECSQQSSPWWESFHMSEMADLFLERNDPVELDQTLEFLKRELHLPQQGFVYDQCCGIGSLTMALAEQGFETVGADLCQIYIDRAHQTLRKKSINCQVYCEDAFHYIPDRPCDAVFNWYSSFGYSHEDSQNIRMFQCAYKALKPGGYFALDVPNFPGLIRGFQKHLVRKGVVNGKQVTLIRESFLELQEGLLRQTWTWLREEEEPVERHSALRLYLPHQICEMLSQSNFEEIQLWGGLNNESFHLDSPRLICVARKPF